ncbi:MAG: rhomboid family intramembrane serine protease [Alphaproteobacteria bacterium]|nr:rhomboid family intramembrane serine protease [Alphaproteobacteria bacterium]
MVHLRLPDEDVTLDWDAFEQRVAAGRVPADALVRIPAVTGEAWVRADSLELYGELAGGRHAAFQRVQAAAGPPLLTALLVGVQVQIWWLARLPAVRTFAEQRLTRWTPPVLEDGEAWRLITMGFVHTSLGHALANLTWLAYVAFHLERALGWRNLLFLYLGSVTGGSVVSLLGSPDAPSLGASGGVFGLIAATVVFGLSRPELLPERARRVFGFALLPYLGLMLASGVRSPNVDNWSHLGGLVAGGVLAMLVDPEGLERRPGRSARVRWAGAAMLVVLLAGLALLGPRLEPLRTEAEARRVALRARGADRAADLDASEAGPLTVFVPVGWSSERLATGEPAWSPPLSPRAWSAVVEQADRPTTATAAVEAARQEIDGLGWETRWEPPHEATLAGRSALELQGTAAMPRPRRVVLRATARGTQVLTTRWLVEEDRAAHLEPLHARLLSALRWTPDAGIEALRARVARAPDAEVPRRELAEALAAAGEGQEALALHAALVAAFPRARAERLAQLRTVGWYPELVPDLDALVDATLAAGLGPPVTAAVADLLDGLDRRDEAAGLLDLAWVQAPGDRSLARARRARHLGIDLDAAGNVRGPPWLPSRAPDALDLDAARAQAARREAARTALVQAIAETPPGEPALVAALVTLAREADGTAEDLPLVRADLERAVEGSTPAWWDPRLPPATELLTRLPDPQP